jgi:hypothetical protein
MRRKMVTDYYFEPGEDVGEMSDPVSHPPHYTKGKIEVYDFIRDQNLPYPLGNVVKYIARHEHKGTPVQDLSKARWYLDMYIEELKQSSE